jgi:protein gp37
MPRNPARIFVGSMTDLFHPMMPPLARATIFARIAAYPQHTFMILTKRPTVMLEYIRTLKYQMTMCLNNAHWLQRRMPNLWLGVSVEDKESAIVRIETLINVPCRNKFVSAEPLLGPVYLQPEWLKNIGWVIAGPETGPGKRHCESEWIDDLMAQCGKNNIPFFDKRKGGWREWPMEMDM